MGENKLKDHDIREPLFMYFEEKYGKCRVLEEICINSSRADVVLILSDKVVGVEIKSDADTYQRLVSQVKNYNRFFDTNWLVVGSTLSLIHI